MGAAVTDYNRIRSCPSRSVQFLTCCACAGTWNSPKWFQSSTRWRPANGSTSAGMLAGRFEHVPAHKPYHVRVHDHVTARDGEQPVDPSTRACQHSWRRTWEPCIDAWTPSSKICQRYHSSLILHPDGRNVWTAGAQRQPLPRSTSKQLFEVILWITSITVSNLWTHCGGYWPLHHHSVQLQDVLR